MVNAKPPPERGGTSVRLDTVRQILAASRAGAGADGPTPDIKVKPMAFQFSGCRQGLGAEVMCIFQVRDETVEIRSPRLADVATLIRLNPDVSWWRSMFPMPGKPHRIDLVAAASFLLNESIKTENYRKSMSAEKAGSATAALASDS